MRHGCLASAPASAGVSPTMRQTQPGVGTDDQSLSRKSDRLAEITMSWRGHQMPALEPHLAYEALLDNQFMTTTCAQNGCREILYVQEKLSLAVHLRQ